jgi:hypothetical protein
MERLHVKGVEKNHTKAERERKGKASRREGKDIREKGGGVP